MNVLLMVLKISAYLSFNIDIDNMKQHSICDSEFGYSLMFKNRDELVVGAPTYISEDNLYFDGAVFTLSIITNTSRIFRRSILDEKYRRDARFGHSMVFRSPNEYLICAPSAKIYKDVSSQPVYLMKNIIVSPGFCEYQMSDATSVFYDIQLRKEYNNAGFWILAYNDSHVLAMSNHQTILKKFRHHLPNGKVSVVTLDAPNEYEERLRRFFHDFQFTEADRVLISDRNPRIEIYFHVRLLNTPEIIQIMTYENTEKIVNKIAAPFVKPGSGFGHTACRMPFNNNDEVSSDEIVIIGDPYMDQNGDVLGAIYVLNLKTNKITLIATGTSRSLFGYKVYCPGDLDGNGYPDLLVSAPYGGRDKKGAVFVYSRIKSKFEQTQIIDVRDLPGSPCQSMFGISFDLLKIIESGTRNNGRQEMLVSKLAIGSLGTVSVFDVLCSYELALMIKSDNVLILENSNFTLNEGNNMIWKIGVCVDIRQNCHSNYKSPYNISISDIHDIHNEIWFTTGSRNLRSDGHFVLISKDSDNPNVNNICQDVEISLIKSIQKRQFFELSLQDETNIRGMRKSPFSSSFFKKKITINKICGGKHCTLNLIATVSTESLTVFQSENSQIVFKVFVQVQNVDADDVRIEITYDSRLKILTLCSSKSTLPTETESQRQSSSVECSNVLGSPVFENTVIEQYIVFSSSEINIETEFSFKFLITGNYQEASQNVNTDYKISQKLCATLHIDSFPQFVNVSIATESAIQAIQNNQSRSKVVNLKVDINHLGLSSISESTLIGIYPDLPYINSAFFNTDCCSSKKILSYNNSQHSTQPYKSIVCKLARQGYSQQYRCEFRMNISVIYEGVQFNEMARNFGINQTFNISFELQYNEKTYHCENITNLLKPRKTDIMIHVRYITVLAVKTQKWLIWIIVGLSIVLLLTIIALFSFLRTPSEEDQKGQEDREGQEDIDNDNSSNI